MACTREVYRHHQTSHLAPSSAPTPANQSLITGRLFCLRARGVHAGRFIVVTCRHTGTSYAHHREPVAPASAGRARGLGRLPWRLLACERVACTREVYRHHQTSHLAPSSAPTPANQSLITGRLFCLRARGVHAGRFIVVTCRHTGTSYAHHREPVAPASAGRARGLGRLPWARGVRWRVLRARGGSSLASVNCTRACLRGRRSGFCHLISARVSTWRALHVIRACGHSCAWHALRSVVKCV